MALREKRLYLEFFWSLYSRIWNKYGNLLRKSSYSVQMRENADKKNSKYRYFPRSVTVLFKCIVKNDKAI